MGASSEMPPEARRAALALGALGLPVFPVHTVTSTGQCSCGASCGRDSGKHPRTPNGFKNASTDPDQIRAWWTRWPDANIAVATGSAAGVWVLDIDPDNGGEDTLATLEAQHGALPATWCTETGGGGFHLWFHHPGHPCSTKGFKSRLADVLH